MTTKLYYKDTDINLYGYTLYIPFTVSRDEQKLPGYCTNIGVNGLLAYSDLLCDTSIGTIPQKSQIYVFPNSKYAADDIRAHYSVKRDPDSGDFNVYSPINLLKSFWIDSTRVETIIYWPSRKIALCTQIRRADMTSFCQTIRKCVPDMTEDEAADYTTLVHDGGLWLYWLNDPKCMYQKVLDGTLKKPLVAPEQLDITNNNKLTIDVLMLLYQTALDTGRFSNKKNIVMQLNMLNQYDWRNYPGTIAVFKSILLTLPSIYKMTKQPSKYNKIVNEFLTPSDIHFRKQEDLELAQSFMYNLLGFDKVMFVRTSDLLERLQRNDIPITTFQTVFDAIVKISPKRIG